MFSSAGVDGQDLSALFDAPKPSPAPAGAPGKAAAYHQYPACDMDWAEGFNVTRAACNNAPRKTFSYMVRMLRWQLRKACGSDSDRFVGLVPWT